MICTDGWRGNTASRRRLCLARFRRRISSRSGADLAKRSGPCLGPCWPRRRLAPGTRIPIISSIGCAIRRSSSMPCGISLSTEAHAEEGLSRFKAFVAFSLSLNRLDGGAFLRAAGDFPENIDPAFLQFVRDDEELRAIAGDRVLGEPRFNPDATLDISKWSRPQHDGPALRALVLMRYWPVDGPRSRDPRRHARLDRDRPLLYPRPLARALFRYLGRRTRPALFDAAFAACGARRWRIFGTSCRRG